MTEKIIALVDGSIYSHSVCENAAWIAGRTGAAVEILHVLGRREGAESADLSGSIALGARSALLEELTTLDEQRAKLQQQRGRAILEDAKAVVERAAPAGKITTRLRIGDIVETVGESEAEADMLVVGKRGEAADFAKLHLGSNLERIIRSSHRPVFVAARAFKPAARFLIAYDGGASSMKAVDHVARSPLFAGLECHIVMVGEENAETRRKLDDASATLRTAGYTVQAHLATGQPEAAISDAANRNAIDLLVMGAYGHSRIRSLIIGSTTTEMIRSCKIPVVLFR